MLDIFETLMRLLDMQALQTVCCHTAIGSGGPYALAAARALIDLPDYDAKAIGNKSLGNPLWCDTSEHMEDCRTLHMVDGPYQSDPIALYNSLRALSCLRAADKAMNIAADTCIYTNHNFTFLTLKADSPSS